jgi:hypothetical protein
VDMYNTGTNILGRWHKEQTASCWSRITCSSWNEHSLPFRCTRYIFFLNEGIVGKASAPSTRRGSVTCVTRPPGRLVVCFSVSGRTGIILMSGEVAEKYKAQLAGSVFNQTFQKAIFERQNGFETLTMPRLIQTVRCSGVDVSLT